MRVALIGLSEHECAAVLQQLTDAIPDARIQRFDDAAQAVDALIGASIGTAVLGSALSPAGRSSVASALGAVEPAFTLLDVSGLPVDGAAAPSPAADTLAGAAVGAVLRRNAQTSPPPWQVTQDSLETALSREQLELHYQPIVSLADRDVVGVEALVRWRHPDLGLLPPEVFIPLAERTGLIIELGAWVLETACAQAAAWKRHGLHLEMAVNVSVRQVTHAGFADQVRRTLAATGLPPQDLLLEVTESAVVEDGAAAARALDEVASMGTTIAIDDFGTGYSSLLYLKRYPVGAVKVDRSFIAGLDLNSDDDAIVASIVDLARAVGAVCIAEGVETVEQLGKLLALGCDRAQGYLFTPPVPAQDVVAAVHAAKERARPDVARPRRPRADEPLSEEVVSQMLELRGAGASHATIAAALNQTGSVHPNGRRWHRSSVAALLTSLQATAVRSTS